VKSWEWGWGYRENICVRSGSPLQRLGHGTPGLLPRRQKVGGNEISHLRDFDYDAIEQDERGRTAADLAGITLVKDKSVFLQELL